MELVSIAKQAVDAIVRPPRRTYDIATIPTLLRTEDGHQYKRFPMNFTNSRNENIVGSIYTDISSSHETTNGGPCAIYLHGNASCQLEGLFLVPNLCKHGITVFLYDCAGSGDSGGEYVSLGLNESEDLRAILTYLETTLHLGPFILWGRSMGAATAIMTRHPRVSGIVVDSTFSALYDLCLSITGEMNLPIMLSKALVWVLRLAVYDCAGFNIDDVSVVNDAKKHHNPPLLMGHAVDDDFIPIEQAKAVFAHYSNPFKSFMELENGHNGARSFEWLSACYNFIFGRFGMQMPTDFRICKFSGFENDEAHFESAQNLMAFAAEQNESHEGLLEERPLESMLECSYYESAP